MLGKFMLVITTYSNGEGIFVVSFGNGFLFCHSIRQWISVVIQGRIFSEIIVGGFLEDFLSSGRSFGRWISVVTYNVDGFLW